MRATQHFTFSLFVVVSIIGCNTSKPTSESAKPTLESAESTSKSGGVTVSFGSGATQFNMEFVEIGDADNAADTTGAPDPAGAVSYVYNIGKFEVSRDMVTKANTEGDLGIPLSASPEFTSADQPATSVSWNEAARFVNWLNTSQGFLPAYKFEFQPGDVGYSANANIELWDSADAWRLDGENRFRHKDARYWLPSVDEWYKAAYYDPVSDSYFNFPTGSDTAPMPVAGGTTADTAVYNRQSIPADIMDAGGLSPFGVMAMGAMCGNGKRRNTIYGAPVRRRLVIFAAGSGRTAQTSWPRRSGSVPARRTGAATLGSASQVCLLKSSLCRSRAVLPRV